MEFSNGSIAESWYVTVSEMGLSNSDFGNKTDSAPPVETLNTILPSSIENTQKVRKNRFPHTELKIVKEIWHKHSKKVEFIMEELC